MARTCTLCLGTKFYVNVQGLKTEMPCPLCAHYDYQKYREANTPGWSSLGERSEPNDSQWRA